MCRKKLLIALLIGASTVSAIFDGLFYLRGVLSPPATADLASTLSVFLLALWINADSKDHPQVRRSFDFGFLVLMFWLPYLPYYLWRTRGPVGLSMFAGFVALLSMGFFVQLMIYGLYHL
jgi:hypothetical protein